MPQTECPAQEEAWRSTTERTPGAFRRLMSQCGSGVENCLLPDSVAGFVEGEHCSVLLKALGDGIFGPSAVWWMPACGTETSRARATCISG